MHLPAFLHLAGVGQPGQGLNSFIITLHEIELLVLLLILL
jgi:hypothetical protein